MIRRWRGRYQGRNRAVAYADLVFTVATAADGSVGVAGQTAQTLAQLESNLIDAGSDRHHILNATVYLADIATKPEMDAVWNDWIGPDPENWPQRACVGAALAGDTLVEITLVAARAPGDPPPGGL